MRKQWIPGALLPKYRAPGNEATTWGVVAMDGRMLVGGAYMVRGSSSPSRPRGSHVWPERLHQHVGGGGGGGGELPWTVGGA